MKKIICIATALICSTLLQAQDTFNFTFNHMALSVKDVHASADFYKKVFQLTEITNRTGHPARRWFSLGEDKELHLLSDIKEPVTINKAVHLALTTKNFDAFVNKLREMKIKFSDWPGTPDVVNIRADGIKQVFLQDIDGYWIEVNSVKE
jgi:catechol 2,3-dioxygenase-like lactoylglutathione lyase family enzyme